jgi:hypothetical protein
LRHAIYDLEAVLAHKLALIRGFSLGPLEDDLTDPDTGFENERKRGKISDLKDLAIVDPGLNKTRGHMNDQTHSSKTAPSLEPAANIVRQFDPFMGNP